MRGEKPILRANKLHPNFTDSHFHLPAVNEGPMQIPQRAWPRSSNDITKLSPHRLHLDIIPRPWTLVLGGCHASQLGQDSASGTPGITPSPPQLPPADVTDRWSIKSPDPAFTPSQSIAICSFRSLSEATLRLNHVLQGEFEQVFSVESNSLMVAVESNPQRLTQSSQSLQLGGRQRISYFYALRKCSPYMKF